MLKMKKLNELSLLEQERLFKTLRIAITHHSNAIEGTTLTYGETKLLLEKHISAANKNIDEQLIILGFSEAYDVTLREANNKQKVMDSSFIKDLHYLIFANAFKLSPFFIKKPIGAYRTQEVKISGIDIELSIPTKIHQDLENLLYRFPSNKMSLEDIALFHSLYEKIHPFSDGNGRTGRLIMSFQSIQNNFIPPLIKNEKRNEYLRTLKIAQLDNNLEPLIEFLQQSQNDSLKLIE